MPSIERRKRGGQLRWYARYRDPTVKVFGSTIGRPLTNSIAGHAFDDSHSASGVTGTPHSLRHYFGASPDDELAGPAAMRAIGERISDSCAISVPSSDAEGAAHQ